MGDGEDDDGVTGETGKRNIMLQWRVNYDNDQVITDKLREFWEALLGRDRPQGVGVLFYLCHRGGKSTWPDRDEPRTSRTPCEHSDHWATEPHGRPATMSPCLIRFVPESARNHAGTEETVPLLLAAQVRTHTEPPNVTGE